MKLFLTCCFLFLSRLLISQPVCDPAGNIVIISNYDGGFLNIIVDANIPDILLGIVSYEATTINISGPFAGNVAGVYYAGFNSNNNHCGTVIPATTITGVPPTIPVSINFAPPSPLSDPNGNPNIICAYSCDTTTTQGGCNTVNQVEAYFLQLFAGYTIYSHTVQYGCWNNPVLISAGGNCCTIAPPALSLIPTISNMSCNNICDGSISIAPQGTPGPYQYLWSTGEVNPVIDSLCAGTYSVTVTDSAGLTVTQQFSITNPSVLNTNFSVVSDAGGCTGQVFAIAGGGTPPYTYLWDSCGTSSGSTASSLNNVCAGSCCLILTDSNGCSQTSCVTVTSTVGIGENGNYPHYPFPNPTNNGSFNVYTETKNIDVSKFSISNQLGQMMPFSLHIGIDQLNFHILSGNGLYFVNIGDKIFKVMVNDSTE